MLRTLLGGRKQCRIPLPSSRHFCYPCDRRERLATLTPDTEGDDKNYLFLHDLPSQFLRDSNLKNFDRSTNQRTNVHFDKETGKSNGISSSCSRNKPIVSGRDLWIKKHVIGERKDCKIFWSDGSVSNHNIDELNQYYLSWKKSRPEDKILWEGLTDKYVRQSTDLCMSFELLIADDGSGMRKAIKTLYHYGILLVTSTPVDDDGVSIAALGAALSGGSVKSSPSASLLANYRLGGTEVILPSGTDGPLRTLFGGVWTTTSSGQHDGRSTADSAYGNGALPLHTDMTYLQDPPGLQIFTMIQPALIGGESVFCDGFAVAESLRTTNPVAFDILSNTSRTFYSRDQITGWDLKANGPVIQVRDGRIVAVRHNDLDRLTDLPPNSVAESADIDAFYESLKSAHENLDYLIAQDRFRLVMKLERGDTMVVVNQRCFHGRYSFKSAAQAPRSLIGCYISQDELSSRFRIEGYGL